MDKRYQVFVSSTYEDLRSERQEVMQALLELDCIPSGMELFPAADEDQWSLIKRVINDCDYYLVILAGRYGSIGPEGKSYTQMEYEYALSIQKPVVAFLHADPGKIQADRTDPENGEKLKRFRELVQRKICKAWSTPQELGSVVSRGIVKLIKDKPGIGWVRANLVSGDDATREILRLKNENEELKLALERSRAEPPPGTEIFASGNEETQLNFSYLFKGEYPKETYRATWNEIFSLLAPLMIDGTHDQVLKDALGEFFRNRKLDRDKMVIFEASIRDEDFQRIKVQFRALGLITKDQRLPKAAYWVLTPYGDTLLTQVAAVRSNRRGDPHDS